MFIVTKTRGIYHKSPYSIHGSRRRAPLPSNNFIYITARKRSFRRLCFHKRRSLCPQGGSASRGVCIRRGWSNPHPLPILWDTVNDLAVHILLECILVSYSFRGKFAKIIGSRTPLWGWRTQPVWEILDPPLYNYLKGNFGI